jgi:hypothetical protein
MPGRHLADGLLDERQSTMLNRLTFAILVCCPLRCVFAPLR